MTVASPSVDYSRKWLVMAAVMSGLLLATIDGSIVNIAFPTIQDDLNASFNVLQWVSLAYLLTIVTLTLVLGRVGDVMGKRKLYLSGFAIFTIASGLCGLAPTITWLIGFRVLQAVGAALIMGLGPAILLDAFPPSERGKALGFVGSAVSTGIIIGPIVGGLIISSFGWRPIFLVNIPVGIAATWLAVRNVPKTPPVGSQRFDIPGTILMSLTLFSVSLALTLGQDLGFRSPMILTAFVVAIVSAVAFVAVEKRVEQPILPVKMFRNPTLSVSVVCGYLVFASLSSTFILMPFYLQGVLGLEVGVVGLLLVASPVCMGLLSPFSGSLSDRIGVRRLTTAGLALMAVSFIAILQVETDSTPMVYLIHAVLLGTGMGLFQSPNNSAIMGSIPKEYAGVGGGVLTVTRLSGSVTGVAVLTSLWAARVGYELGGTLPPGGATEASPAAQVAALHFTYRIVLVIMVVALIIGIWGLRNEKKQMASASV